MISDDLFPKGNTNRNKAKGNINERNLCKCLTKWTGIRFIRVPQSGGFRQVDHPMFIGDVVTGEGDPFPFVIETKHLQKFQIKESLRANSRVVSIWQQVLSDSIRAKRMPCMFLRYNGMKAGQWFFVVADWVGNRLKTEFPELEIKGLYAGDPALIVFDTEALFAINFSKFLVVSKNLLSLHYERTGTE